MRATTLPLLAGVLLLPSCVDEPAPPPPPDRDTSGAETVMSETPAWSDAEAWRVDTARLRIGQQDGPEELQLYRIMDATRLEDGTLVVSNAGTGELRFYAPDGRFLRSAGRQGAGPGEFARFSSLRLCRTADGRLMASDGGNNRFNVARLGGEHVETVALEPAGGGRPPGLVGCTGGGEWIGISWADGGVLQGKPGTLIRTGMAYVLVDSTGAVRDTVASVPTRPRWVNELDGITHYPFIPFTPDPSVAAGASGVYVSAVGAPAVDRYGEGELRAVYRWASPARKVVAEVRDRYVEESLSHISDDNRRRRYARFYDADLPLPDSTPAVASLVVDAEGNLWAERYRLPWEGEAAWDVLDPDGRWLGTVALPEPVTVFEIGSDYLLGRHTDDLGVERLVLYGLEKP